MIQYITVDNRLRAVSLHHIEGGLHTQFAASPDQLICDAQGMGGQMYIIQGEQRIIR